MSHLHGPFLLDGPTAAPLTVLLAHGAGAGMEHPFMAAVAAGLGARGWRVLRFEFPYMQQRRLTGKKRGPDTPARLEATLRSAVAAAAPPGRLVLAGKSMGGRVSSMFVDELGCRGLICLGYPFHPPGRPDKLRTAHLLELRSPALILQGERDPFGTREEVPGYGLSPGIELRWIPDGDHSLRPRKRSGHSEEGNLAVTVEACDGFLRGLCAADA
jgi:predicted alpha/beta-hydrolase family hydrolase